ncbi:MAG TPA: hypothetical protein EYH04_03030 [Archaeoglobus profundus]|nr:hypothetical protein [Archaeoglobus profundus]
MPLKSVLGGIKIIKAGRTVKIYEKLLKTRPDTKFPNVQSNSDNKHSLMSFILTRHHHLSFDGISDDL